MRIFYDVDTQNDFMNKDGALYVPDAELIKPNLAALTDFAIKNNIPIVGSVDMHFGTEKYKERELELARWGGPFPDHCIEGTVGQMKIIQTVLNYNAYEGGDMSMYLNNPIKQYVTEDEIRKKRSWMGESDEETIKRVVKSRITGISSLIELAVENLRNLEDGTRNGVYFEKQSYDVFTNPNAEELLKRAKVSEAVVYGVATDYCVKAAVLGMQKRGVQCYVVEDAIKGVAEDTTNSALEEMLKIGVKFVKTKEILEGKIWKKEK